MADCLGRVHHLSAFQVYTMPVPPSRITFMSPAFLPGCNNAVSGSSFRPSGSPDSVPRPDANAALAFRSANEASYAWCQGSLISPLPSKQVYAQSRHHSLRLHAGALLSSHPISCTGQDLLSSARCLSALYLNIFCWCSMIWGCGPHSRHIIRACCYKVAIR